MTSTFVVAGESLARLDVPTTLMTRIGDDEFGRLAVQHVEASDVSLSPGPVVPGAATSTATARLDERQAATYEFDIFGDLPRRKIPAHALALHVGSVGAALRCSRDARPWSIWSGKRARTTC